MSAAPTRIRLLLATIAADDPAWAAWQADQHASPQAARIILQRVSPKSGPQPAVGLGFGETLRWFAPIGDAATRRLVIEYAEQVLAASAFVSPGPELQPLIFDPSAATDLRCAAFGTGGSSASGVRLNNMASVSARETVEPGNVAPLSGGAGIVLLSHAETDLLALQRAVDDLPAGFPVVTGRTLNAVRTADELSALIGRARGARFAAVVRVHGTAASVPGLAELIADAQHASGSIVVISGIGADAGPLPRTSDVSHDLAAALTAYFMAGGVGNVVQAMRRVAHDLLGVRIQYDPPIQMPAQGLYHPDLLVTSPEEWQTYRIPNKPLAVVLFYRAHVLSGNLQFIDQVVRALELRGFAAVGVFTSSLRDRDDSGSPAALRLVEQPAVIVNTLSFPVLNLTSLERPPAEAQHTSFEAMGVPIIQAVCSGTTRAVWKESARGLGPAEAAMNIALPECDGRIITVPISFKENHRYVPDDERIGRVADIARRLASLRVTPNRDKRLAIVLSNSGGKAQKIGGAVGLDTPASLLRFLSDMRDEGYDVGVLPPSPDDLMSALLARGSYDEKLPLNAADAWRMPRASYTHWFRAQSAGFKKAVREAWGEPTLSGATLAPPFWRAGRKSDRAPLLALHEPHTDEADYLFSGVAFGKVLVAVQPPRGFGFDQETMYHSQDLPPCHHYAAFYRWLDQGWRADAVIHFGTHGTLEWLPGKSLAPSADCAPDVLLGDMPLFYPFVVNNPGEGAQAKRRTHAVIIDHLVPPLTQAETYGPLAALARLVEEYYRAESMDPSKLTILRGQIWDLVRTEQLEEDLKQVRRERHADHVHSWDDRLTEEGVPRGLEVLSGRGFAHLIEDLDAYLCDLGRAQIRGGLHVFGVAPTGDALVDLMFAILYSPNGEIPSLIDSVIGACGISPATLRIHHGIWLDALPPVLAHVVCSGEEVQGSAAIATVTQVRTAIDLVARNLLVALAAHDFATGTIDEVLVASGIQSELRHDAPSSPDALSPLRTVLEFACTRLAPSLARTTDETHNLLRALNGHYVPAGPSGAPTRGMAHVLPTGRNFYTVDPRGLPTPAAWSTGSALADAALRRFHDDENRWPENIVLSVWGTPTLRTGGDEIAQALALLGVKPLWEPVTRRTCGLEIVPVSELGHPRIDVTLRVSGFFRDAFPALMHLFDEAVQRVVMLDEPSEQNYPRKHWLAETAALIAERHSPEVAARRASFRVFSSKPGAYGTGVMDLIDNRSWRRTEDIAEVFLAWSGWAYADSTAVQAADVFRRRMTTVELALHNRDNREQDLFDSSDQFEYHGGLVAAAASLSGSQPHAYVGDSSDAARPDVRSLKGEALRVFRTRVINPKWLAGIQRHGYRGGTEIAATIDSLFGFAATAGVISDWMFESAAGTFAHGEMRAFLERTNPWALNAVVERLLEAEQRQLWSAKAETLEALRSVLLATEASLEGYEEEPLHSATCP